MLSGEIAWAVTTAARYVPGATCLTQALAAQRLHTRSGCATELRLGATKGPDDVFRAHAWLERGDRVVVGGEERDAYAAFPRLPFGEDRTQRAGGGRPGAGWATQTNPLI